MLALLDPHDPTAFPHPDQALREPNGLLAVGGDLSVTRLHHAYRHGIFPWFSPGDPLLWWSPDPRLVLFPDQVHISRSLAKRLRQQRFTLSFDVAFARVIRSCAAPRDEDGGTWLVPEMIAAYENLHQHHLAHSVEVWRGEQLVGGLYGVAIGRVFFGESMFSRVSDASKIALVHLCQQLAEWEFGVIDCQMQTAHLQRMGAVTVPRATFLTLLDQFSPLPGRLTRWNGESVR
ncbi:leucyl/phenylalanyl-tRNA--protein transferase [Chromatium okenii]|uniref:Leucyl/phenylalanyl-tRNA--protein transferase n=1 Tax=Chromatium okenii TaxID=61644 RepID=A0A2S7XRD4_9GAMM|nr:leucyl/phenylalanyl-tRNA--protein transferase [Chromatium okenii]MBV5307953.1 leucyl/phenylalanyl-tRNA--protein transferase [Chromatium okenii]PQJ96297.1 leucyl/phenylalanyl-tRNA--protein transferase [Chromatium okenii]